VGGLASYIESGEQSCVKNKKPHLGAALLKALTVDQEVSVVVTSIRNGFKSERFGFPVKLDLVTGLFFWIMVRGLFSRRLLLTFQGLDLGSWKLALGFSGIGSWFLDLGSWFLGFQSYQIGIFKRLDWCSV